MTSFFLKQSTSLSRGFSALPPLVKGSAGAAVVGGALLVSAVALVFISPGYISPVTAITGVCFQGVAICGVCLNVLLLKPTTRPSHRSPALVEVQKTYHSDKSLVMGLAPEGAPQPTVYLKLRRVFQREGCSLCPHKGHPAMDALAYILDSEFYGLGVVPRTTLYASIEEMAKKERIDALSVQEHIDATGWEMKVEPQLITMRQYGRGPDFLRTLDGRFLDPNTPSLQDTTLIIVQEAVHSSLEMPPWWTKQTSVSEKEKQEWIARLELDKERYLAALFYNLLVGRMDNDLQSTRNSCVANQQVLEFDNDLIGAPLAERAESSWLLLHPLSEKKLPKELVEKILILEEEGLRNLLNECKARRGVVLPAELQEVLIQNLTTLKVALKSGKNQSAKQLVEALRKES